MGLDSFKSDDNSDEDEEQNSSTSQSSTGSKTSGGGSNETITEPFSEEDIEFYGTENPNPGTRPMERKGAMSNHSMGELAQNVHKELAFGEDHIKLHLPVFTIISRDEEYEQGHRYQLSYPHDGPEPAWSGKVVVCMTTKQIRLGNMNKEVAMFDGGSTSKKRVMDKFNSTLGSDLDADTDVYINFFGDVFFMRDLAQGNEQFREGDLVNRDDLGSKVVRPKQLRVRIDDSEEED